MNQWAFVAAAYGVTVVGLIALVGWAWSAMHRAEKRLDK